MKEAAFASAPELSVIIPAYNASKTIIKTLTSLTDQTVSPDRWEIIVVDDGSTDDTLAICRSFAALYGNIQVVHQENGGVSSARNAGIQLAHGRWITFLDSDDYVEKHYVETLITVDPESELVILDTWLVPENRRIREKDWLRPYFDRRVEIPQVRVWICENRLNSPCDKRFSLDVIRKNRIRFEEGVNMAEDLLFNFQYARQVSAAYICGRAVYVHPDNPEGLCRRRVTGERLAEYETVYGKLREGCAGDARCAAAVELAFLRLTARYAGQLRTSGFSTGSITGLLAGSEMVKNVLAAPAASWKDRVRKFLLKARLYDVCAVVLKYR